MTWKHASYARAADAGIKLDDCVTTHENDDAGSDSEELFARNINCRASELVIARGRKRERRRDLGGPQCLRVVRRDTVGDVEDDGIHKSAWENVHRGAHVRPISSHQPHERSIATVTATALN